MENLGESLKESQDGDEDRSCVLGFGHQIAINDHIDIFALDNEEFGFSGIGPNILAESTLNYSKLKYMCRPLSLSLFSRRGRFFMRIFLIFIKNREENRSHHVT